MPVMNIWYLVQTKPRQEFVAKENLSNQGYKVYCPLFKLKNTKKPLFPRYLFINFENNSKSLSPIRSTKGVSNFVRFGVNFATVPNNIIKNIKNQEQETIDKAIKQSRPHKGDKVQITQGIFQGNQAIFEKYNDDERVTLLFRVLQQEQKIQFSADQFKVI